MLIIFSQPFSDLLQSLFKIEILFLETGIYKNFQKIKLTITS